MRNNWITKTIRLKWYSATEILYFLFAVINELDPNWIYFEYRIKSVELKYVKSLVEYWAKRIQLISHHQILSINVMANNIIYYKPIQFFSYDIYDALQCLSHFCRTYEWNNTISHMMGYLAIRSKWKFLECTQLY